MKKSNSFGQSLLELVISIGLILIIITAVTILTVNGLKNSQFSRNQVQATKLAQEGVEKMRTIRDNNFTICGWASSANTVAPNGLWSAACPAGCRYILQQTAGTCGATPTSALWVNFTASSSLFESVNIGGIIYQRVITVTNGTDLSGAANVNVKRINVTVTWTDSSGTHNSNVETILSRI